jgi:CheY-like chemotaxis protein
MIKIVGTSLVAVIDDDDLFRRTIARLLQSSGFRVETFESAEAFLTRGTHRGSRDGHSDASRGAWFDLVDLPTCFGSIQMLIITVDTTAAIATVRFNGRLAAPEIHEVSRIWTTMPFKPPHQRVLLDLTPVTAIDAVGKEFLKWALREGHALESGVTTHAIVDEIVATSHHDMVAIGKPQDGI